jgi:hypothetical protein
MALKFLYGFGTTPFADLPFTPLQGDHLAAPASSTGAAKVKVETVGEHQAANAVSSAAAKVRVDGIGVHQASDATSGGVLYARLLIAGAGFALPATSGGIVKPPPLQTAAQARTGQVHLVSLSALRRAMTRSVVNFQYGFGTTPFAALPEDSNDSTFVEMEFTDRGYTSPNAGTKANTIFEGRVQQPLQMTRTIPVAPESTRRVALELGAITLINNDGFFDAPAREYSVDGRLVTVMLGLQDFVYDDFRPVFTGRATSWLAEFNTLSVELRDQSYVLDVTLQSATYGGTGGADGTSSLAGKPKPHCFGKCRFVTPVAVDPANLVYQFHWRSVQAVDAAYDRANTLTATTDYASYAALIAATLSIGEYATCLAEGMVRLGGKPSYLTLDVRGEAEGGYIDSTADIAKRMITGYGSELTDDNLDAATWDALADEVPGTIGVYFTDSILISDAVSQVLGHCGAWWGADQDGMIVASILDEPDPSDIAYTFDEANVKSINRVAPPDGTFPPRWRQRVGYQKTWTVHSSENIAPEVDADVTAVASEEYRVVSASDDAVRTEFLTASDPDPLDGLFDEADDAQAIADKWLALLSPLRQTLQIVTTYEGYIPKIGTTVALIYRRAGSGWNARVIDFEVDAQNREITLILWG